MTRRHQHVGSRQHERWYQFGIRRVPVARGAILALAALVFSSPWSMGQSTTQLNGSVSDSSGASISGAKITLIDVATQLNRTTTSSAAGLYQFLDVPPGRYRLEATATGFAQSMGQPKGDAPT